VLETINQLRPVKIVAIEDPIEFLFEERLAIPPRERSGWTQVLRMPEIHKGSTMQVKADQYGFRISPASITGKL
jgi:hypothetical protein